MENVVKNIVEAPYLKYYSKDQKTKRIIQSLRDLKHELTEIEFNMKFLLRESQNFEFSDSFA